MQQRAHDEYEQHKQAAIRINELAGRIHAESGASSFVSEIAGLFVKELPDQDSERALGSCAQSFPASRRVQTAWNTEHDSVGWWFDDNLEQPHALLLPSDRFIARRAERFHASKTPVLTAGAMGERVRFWAAIMGLRPRATDTVGWRFRPRAEHGSLAVRGREWTRNCAIPTRRSAFPDSSMAPKYAERPQTGQTPATPFIPKDFRPSFGAGKRATFCPSGG